MSNLHGPAEHSLDSGWFFFLLSYILWALTFSIIDLKLKQGIRELDLMGKVHEKALKSLTKVSFNWC